jgi:hypothetical protein
VAAHPYRITVSGGLGAAARAAFDGLEITTREGVSDIRGEFDQAALYGALHRVEQFALELVEVRRED